MEKIATKAADLQQTFDTFRQRQTGEAWLCAPEHKQELRRRLKSLEDELNQHLAAEYGVKASDKAAYAKWLKSYQPFHWFIEFYGIMSGGGFDVILGNPPYIVNTSEKVPYSVKQEQFATYNCREFLCVCVRTIPHSRSQKFVSKPYRSIDGTLVGENGSTAKSLMQGGFLLPFRFLGGRNPFSTELKCAVSIFTVSPQSKKNVHFAREPILHGGTARSAGGVSPNET